MNLALFKRLWTSLQMDKTVGEDAPISFLEFLEVALRDMPEPPSLGVSDEEAQEIVDAGIISLNNFLADDELEGRPALVQGGITLE